MKAKVIFLLFLLSSSAVYAKLEKQKIVVDYIEKYASIAMINMEEHKIPASITLAQGILESGAGQSELAKMSNNHFGIKCHNDWTGEKVYHDDDQKQECFRKYKSPELSFEDHSQFLKKERYQKLYEYEITDYKSWAKGLKECGYATDPNYAKRLIEIIESYDLSLYDTGNFAIAATAQKNDDDYAEPDVQTHTMGTIPAYRAHKINQTGGFKTVKALEGDTYESIAEEFDLQIWQIRRLNQVKRRDHRQPESGETVIIGK